MKKRLKKALKSILTISLCLIMVIGSIPLSGFVGLELPDFFKTKAEAASYSGKCGRNLNWSLDRTTGELVISGTGEMKDWEGFYSPPWFDLYNEVKSVNIESGVTSIANNAFYGSKITYINIPDTVEKIGPYAFGGLGSLLEFYVDKNNQYYSNDEYGVLYNKEKTILMKYSSGSQNTYFCVPETVTTICGIAFFVSKNLKTVKISDSVTSIGESAFNQCEKLTNIDMGENVVSWGYGIFSGCSSLRSIQVPKNITAIDTSMFLGCSSLTKFEVDEFNPAYSSDEHGVLFNKDKTTLLIYPTGNIRTTYIIPDGVTSIGDSAFENCHNLMNVKIPDSVLNVGLNAFNRCENLTNVDMSENAVSWGGGIFSGCSSLRSIQVPKNITAIDTSMFLGCSSLTKFEVDEFNSAYSSDENGVLFNKNKTELIMYPRGNEASFYIIPDSVSNICDGAFRLCKNLLTISIGSGVSSIGDSAFIECKNLTGILMPANITKIGKSAFDFCDSLSAVYYTSSKEKWKTIDIEEYGNEDLLNATITYDYISGDCAFSFGIYSSSPSLATTVGDNFVVTLSLYDFNNQFVEEWGAPSVVVGNPDIVKVGIPQRIDGTNNPNDHLLYTLRIEGVKEGSSDIIITDTVTGAIARMTVSIQSDLCFTFTLDNLPEREMGIWGETDTPTNIYNLDGLYVNSFKYEKTDNGYLVTFNVYNCSYMNGSVDVFDKETGNWIKTQKIKKHTEISNVKEIFDVLFYPLINTKDFFSYDASINSEETNVRLEVPEGSYITISNNVMKSPGACLYNFVDLFMMVVDVAFEISSYKQAYDEVCNTLSEELIMTIFDDESIKDLFVSKYSDFANDLFASKVEEETGLAVMSDYVYKTKEFFVNSLEIDLESIVESLCEVKTEIALEALAPTQVKIALDAIFLATSITSKIAQVAEMLNSEDNQYVSIHTTDYSDTQTIQGVTVCDKNTELIRTASLQVFRVTANQNISFNNNNTAINYDDYVLYNIGFFEKGEKVQPNGKVEVKIPIPEQYDPNNCVVLHKTSDGWEKMLATVQGDYLVFETDNFSLYAVVNTASIHIHTESEAVIENHIKAECDQTGSCDSVIYCSVCGDEISRETITIDALIHQYNKAITQPSCTEVGYTTYTCSLCGDTYIDDEIDALEHDIVIDEAVAATCTKTGLSAGRHCSRCDEKTVAQEVIPVKDHSYIEKYDSAKHWKECQCGLTIEEQNHSFASGNICACGYTRTINATIKIINNTGSKTINYGETLKLSATVMNKPADANIVWYVDGVKQGVGETFDLRFESGTKTIEVKLVDASGNEIKDSSGNEIKDTEKVSVNASFWQKIVSFFKNLFGMNRTVIQTIFKNVF